MISLTIGAVAGVLIGLAVLAMREIRDARRRRPGECRTCGARCASGECDECWAARQW